MEISVQSVLCASRILYQLNDFTTSTLLLDGEFWPRIHLRNLNVENNQSWRQEAEGRAQDKPGAREIQWIGQLRRF